MEVRIWSVFDREGRLVVAVSDQPGEFNFSRIPDDDVEPIECAFCTVQCYATEQEPVVLTQLARSGDVEEFLDRLIEQKYRVVEGRPRPFTFARL